MLAAGVGAAVTMSVAGVIGGCASVTDGDPRADSSDAPAYRSSVALSVSESAASSSVRESERQESVTTQAIHTACETMSTSSADAVDAVNTYVDAFNGEGSEDPATVEGPAADALNHSADLVSGDIDDALPVELRDALRAWVDAARGAAGVVTGHLSADEFNVAIRQVNDTRTAALNLCDSHY